MRPFHYLIAWWDKPVTHGDLVVLGGLMFGLQLVLFYPFLWVVWMKM